MPDVLFDGLPVIDLLELTPSTSSVAALIQRDQSSISRIYREASRKLDLDFRKHRDGFYRAANNLDLLAGLRRSSQWLRLNGSAGEPRWLICGQLEAVQPLLAPNLSGLLLERRCTPARLAELVAQRVLDAVVVTVPSLDEAATEAATAEPDLLALPLLSGPAGLDVLLIRRDLHANAAVAELRRGLQQAGLPLVQGCPDLEWLA